MLLVVDTNIIISCIIRNSKTREILLSAKADFITPDWVQEEIAKHYDLIAKKAGLTSGELNIFIGEVFNVVRTVHMEHYQHKMPEAREIMNNFDSND